MRQTMACARSGEWMISAIATRARSMKFPSLSRSSFWPSNCSNCVCSGWSARYGSASLATLRSHSSSRIIENSASLLGKWL